MTAVGLNPWIFGDRYLADPPGYLIESFVRRPQSVF